MRKLLIALTSIFILLFTTGCENGTLSGQVTDSNGMAVKSAKVVVVSSSRTDATTTDENGEYSVEKLPSGEDVSVTISKELYITHNASVNVSRKISRETTYDAVLELEEVVVIVPKGSIKGVITDTAGNILEGARVFSASSETLTDENGTYFLEVNADENTSISAEFNNYAQNSRVVTVEANATTYLNISLVVVDAVETFDASAGATIFTKGATIELPTSYTLEDGTAYEGQVTAKIAYNRVTSLDGNRAFPGEYTGLQTDGTTTVLQSYGFIDVTLSDDVGNKLKMADGSLATLTYPMDTNIEATPATIPLWYYDITQGIWVEDGVATYDAATNTYSGEVTHFTTWNLDAKVARAQYQSCVVDATGAAVTNAKIKLTTAGWSRTFTNNDATGKFGFINAPSGLSMRVSASLSNYTSLEKVFTLSAGENKNDTNCLKIDVDVATLNTKVKGRIVFEDGSAVINQYVSIRSGGYYLTDASTDSNGYFITNTFLKPQDGKISVSVSVNIGGKYKTITKEYLLDGNAALNNIGDIVISTAHLDGCVVMSDGSDLPAKGLYLAIDEPYTYEDNYVSSDGIFSVLFDKDFLEHTIYVGNWDNSLTVSTDVVFDTNNIDLSSPCLKLEVMPAPIPTAVSASITSADSEKYLAVYFEYLTNYEYPGVYGDRIIDGEGYWDYSNLEIGEYIEGNPVTSATFDITKNGVYYIFQKQNNWSIFDGTISVTVNGVTHTVTIPVTDQDGEAWAGFALEVYKGEIKVIEINKRAQRPS